MQVSSQGSIVTDHSPLQWLFNCRKPGLKLVRWKLRLQEYDYDVIYKKGKGIENDTDLSIFWFHLVQIKINLKGKYHMHLIYLDAPGWMVFVYVRVLRSSLPRINYRMILLSCFLCSTNWRLSSVECTEVQTLSDWKFSRVRNSISFQAARSAYYLFLSKKNWGGFRPPVVYQ